MVSKISIVFMIFSVVVCFGLPIGLVIYFYKKYKISLFAVVVGILTFSISQMIIRLPLISYLNTKMWFVDNIKSNNILYILFLAFSAGIFEEIARFLGFKFCLKNKLSWKNGIACGIGHGGIEAVLLVGITYVSNIVLSSLINSSTFDTVIVPKMPQAVIMRETLINTSSYMFLFGGLERIFTIILHIAFSIVVLEGVIKKQGKYLLYAILLHTFIDFIAVYNINVFMTEGFLFGVAVLSIIFLKKSKERFNEFNELNEYDI